LLDYLADDYQLGHKIVRNGASIVLCPVVAECRSEPMAWKAVWIHQLRWARTIRVCQPGPFLLSILSNATVWPLLWAVVDRTVLAWSCAAGFILARVLTARANYSRLARQPLPWSRGWLVLLKDLLGVLIWALAFMGNQVQWRGRRFRMLRDGRLEACA
jgi:ceramide glucosyltransferase